MWYVGMKQAGLGIAFPTLRHQVTLVTKLGHAASLVGNKVSGTGVKQAAKRPAPRPRPLARCVKEMMGACNSATWFLYAKLQITIAYHACFLLISITC